MKKNVYFVQAGMAYDTAVYLPYASGCLAAYAWQDETIADNFEIADFLFRHESVDAAFDRLSQPFLVSFSCCIWNFEYSKALAKKVRQHYPNALIVFGGHNIPDDFSVLRDNAFVDILFHGESEDAFLALLKTLVSGDSWHTVPNISFRDAHGNYVRTEIISVDSVAQFPSPYLTGLFDRYIQNAHPGDYCYIMETNRGCPYRCAYCDWCFSEKVRPFPMERIRREIDWFARHKAEYIFCADANFGILERDYEIAQYIVDVKKKTGYPIIFNGCYAKNSNDVVFKISKLLYDNKANKAATLAYQSMNTAALLNVHRKNFTVESFSNLLQQYNEAGIPTYTEMILGLPGETYNSFCAGLCDLIEAGQHTNSTVYACQVYCNSLMGQKVFQEKHGIRVARMPINYIRFLPPRPGEVQEYIDVVVATATMSREDMANSMTFCTCLQCFHHIGLLRCFAAFLRHEHRISYLEFYNRLLAYLLSADGTLLQDLFLRINAMCLDIESGEWTYSDKRFGETGWFLEEGAFMELVYEYDRFWAEIEPFLEEFGIEKPIYTELLVYQKSIVRRPHQKVVTMQLNYDFYAYFFRILTNTYQPLEARKNTMTVAIDGEVSDWVSYARYVMLFAKRRGDTVITSSPKNVSLAYSLDDKSEGD